MVYVSFLLGLLMICKGGDWFVDAASGLAEISGIPRYVIGATIVSFATTMPEMIVSVAAALQGHPVMAIGNAIGSVSANTGIILAISLVFMPVAIRAEEYLTKTIIYIGTLILLLLSFKDRSFGNADCLFLLIAGILFLTVNVRAAVRTRESAGDKRKKEKLFYHILWFFIGAGCVIAGSRFLISSACSIARIFHISEDIISVTILAMGTSLPEFVTTVTAIKKGESSLSIGNIVGANMIDAAFILPVCTLLGRKALFVSEQMARIDMPVCLVLSVAALLPMLIRKKIRRADGIVVLIIYSIYLILISGSFTYFF